MVRAPLMSLDEATALVLAQASRAPLAPEWVSTLEAQGRVLRQAVVSALDVPAQDNTAMDGYALNTEDLAQWPQCAPLKVSQRIPAGQVGQPLQRGEAARIDGSSARRAAPCPVGRVHSTARRMRCSKCGRSWLQWE